MGKQRRRSFRFYTAWNYQKEIEDLNRESEQGWQLVKGGCLSSTFQFDPSIRYRYQLDYPGKIEDQERYLELFQEQGWEHMNATFNGWQYFRKKYDPTAPEESYKIFTDRASLQEMNGHWVNAAIILAVATAFVFTLQVLLLFFEPGMISLLRMVSSGVLLLILIRGIWIMKNTEKNQCHYGDNVFFIGMLLVYLGCWVATICLE